MTTPMREPRLVETDEFPFEFLSQLAKRESWRKEIHRPIYHVHKWWAKRLGSVFRGILLGCALPTKADLQKEFYRCHSLDGLSVFDPFMGSGTTIGEAHKLGMTALGRDINPVAVEAVRTALGPLDRRRILDAFEQLSESAGKELRALYRTKDAKGRTCHVLYYFWVMQTNCPGCHRQIDLFSTHVIARNACPNRKPEVQIRCPACGDIFQGQNGHDSVTCPHCHHHFDATNGPANGAKAACPGCQHCFTILKAKGDQRPAYRLYAKLVLTTDGYKQYLPVTEDDLQAYAECSRHLRAEVDAGRIRLPNLRLEFGYNTRQAMNYNFRTWTDFFNDRQLLALGLLRAAIVKLDDAPTRNALLTLFSGILEFNNLFATYKGEGTGAVRHMFSHHILKPERAPIEANVWGTPKSSGGFSNLFRSRLLRAIDYREAPSEVNGRASPGRVSSKPFSGQVEANWPTQGSFCDRGIYLSQADSSVTGLPDGSVDIIATDPPFFDNVHYSELADFFYAWHQIAADRPTVGTMSTRHPKEVQDSDSDLFATKLLSVFSECRRILKDDGLFVFTYHHSRNEGWHALAEAIYRADFVVLNSQPVKSELSVATPKTRAKEPIQLDIVIVCRKASTLVGRKPPSPECAMNAGRDKLHRLADAGFALSRNDRKVVLYGQMLTAISAPDDLAVFASLIADELATGATATISPVQQPTNQPLLFGA
jgi:putative DNA methylase